jgi:PHD/YefM family antitoxin component YafN of YafNO toxin-antitoxin module
LEYYGTQEEFEKELKKEGLTIEDLLKIKEVELRMLSKVKQINMVKYKTSEYNSEEEEIYEQRSHTIRQLIKDTKSRIKHYKDWVSKISTTT